MAYLWVTDLIFVTEIDAKIREIPYGFNSRFSLDKGCLVGTRVAFLDFIINWVNNPASERGLVLFGQAGTGKSSIAHEIARQFDKMNRLSSSFIFLRREQSVRKAYHLFTTLARNLADRYPSFKIALGKVVKDKTELRVGTRDYHTLFESLILEPLKDLHIVGPILVVIDALDESGDTTGKTGLHAFLAENLKRLPSNFRVVITSRPEHDIVSALARAPSVKIKDMNDTELAAETHKDILTFLRGKLPSDKLGDYVEALAVKAEGLFQWAAVASQLVLDPPERFYYSEETCIKHLLEPSTNRHGQDLLDELYKEVLEGYFKDQDTRDIFRSVAGQLITSIEPISIRSLMTLRQHASSSYDKRSDATVTGLLRRLGSLLSNVNSSDNSLPIIPLHTSFRDFLINQDKSGDFFVGVRDAHHQLAHSCLNLLLDPLDGLKFNICKLETSYLANDNVKDLNTRIDEHIPPALLYACRFWDDHLKHIDFKTDLFRKVETLFKEKFLFWLETLSLTRNIGLAPSAFATLNIWLASSQGVSVTAGPMRNVITNYDAQ
jgi:NACHT domain